MTGRSIEFAMEEAFTPLYGARKDEDAVQKILIVLTDGRFVDISYPRIHGPPADRQLSSLTIFGHECLC